MGKSASPLKTRMEHTRVVLQKHRRLLTCLVIIAGILLTLPTNSFSSIQTIDDQFNALDGSWRLELPARLQWGEWSGRDFIFTYGPLYQLTHALGLLIPPHDVASLLRFHGVLESVLVMLFAWAALRTSQAPLFWRSFSYVSWAFIYSFFSYEIVGLKPLGAACLITLCGFWLGRKSPSRAYKYGEMALWAGTAPVTLLYAFDMGLYSFLALLLLGVVVYVSTFRVDFKEAVWLRQRSLAFLAAVVGGSVSFCTILLSLRGWRNYLGDSLELARAYVSMMTMGLSMGDFTILLSAAAVSIAVIGIVALHLRRHLQTGQLVAARTPALLGLACFALFATRSGFTRSDNEHILSAIFPCIFLCVPFGTCQWHAAKKWYAPVVSLSFVPVGLIFCIFFSINVADAHYQRSAFFSHPDFRPAQLHVTNKEIKGAVELARKVKSASLFVWPVQTLVGLMEQKRNVVYTVQCYAAVTPRLEKITISRMARLPDLPVVFIYRDSVPIDNVENLTRNPLIFRYILENYEATTQKDSLAVLLTKRPENRQRHWRNVPTSVSPRVFHPAVNQDFSFSAPSGRQALHATDLIVLQMKCAKTSLFPIRKPGRLFIEFVLSNNQRKLQIFLLPPDGQSHEVLVCPTITSDPDFLRLFAPRPQPPSLVTIRQVNLKWRALDVLSVAPTTISIERIFKLQPKR